ncbi:peptidoglycan-binding protein [Methylocella sp.]|uniref:peptidoglycan-binding protein n=1 Tax=Methylocella sp. TaxID=1978226 RepID=UPI003783F56B
MPLRSQLFRNDARLRGCLAEDRWHVTQGCAGDYVHRIQIALIEIDDARIASGELAAKLYGPSTAAAVLGFKQARDIVNRSYQSQADDIVGKMTIAALDDEMLERERGRKIMVSGCVCCFHKDDDRNA